MISKAEQRSGALVQGFSSLAHGFSHLTILLFATVVLALERDWGMTYAELFALSVPMAIMFGAAALPAGWLADRWSQPGMITIFFLGVGGATILTGLAQSPLMLAVGLTAIGIFSAIYHPVGIPWLVSRAKNRGRALGVNGVAGSVGTALASVLAGFLADRYGWRAAFVVPGAACMAAGVVFAGYWRAGQFGEGHAVAQRHVHGTAADTKRVFVVLALTVLCTGTIFQVLSFALPKIFAERLSGVFGGGMTGVGGMVSAVYALAALAQIVGGELADRYSLKRVYIVMQILQLPIIAIGFYLIHPALILVAGLMVSLNVAGQPAENALLAQYTPPAWRGTAFGAKFVLTLGVSAAGVALIPLAHRLAGSLDPLFVALFALAAVAAVAAARLPSHFKPAERPAAAAESPALAGE
jgi:MFS transporter, FSR family, fosmidomycin resistance protein